VLLLLLLLLFAAAQAITHFIRTPWWHFIGHAVFPACSSSDSSTLTTAACMEGAGIQCNVGDESVGHAALYAAAICACMCAPGHFVVEISAMTCFADMC
jgi:hypothetical protein